MAEFIELRTVLLPGTELSARALEIAGEITVGQNVLFRLDNQNFFAHLTLHNLEYPEKNLTKVLQATEEIAKATPAPRLVYKGFSDGFGYVGLAFEKSAELETLHEKFLEAMNPLREGHLRAKYETGIAAGKYNLTQREHIRKYGYHNVLEDFQPHLTLTRFADEAEATRIARDLNTAGAEIAATPAGSLAVCLTGPNGTCVKILKAFGFGTS
jgi:2'-5' RNA ligase